jgi:hypothetical protein
MEKTLEKYKVKTTKFDFQSQRFYFTKCSKGDFILYKNWEVKTLDNAIFCKFLLFKVDDYFFLAGQSNHMKGYNGFYVDGKEDWLGNCNIMNEKLLKIIKAFEKMKAGHI